jgi:DNA-binding transcriptional regulator YhcF (GntR family)
MERKVSQEQEFNFKESVKREIDQARKRGITRLQIAKILSEFSNEILQEWLATKT